MGALRAGKLDRRVSIQRRGASANDGFGNQPGAWAEVAQRWASVQPARGSEASDAEGQGGVGLMSFWLRFDNVTRAIASTDTLVLDGKRYEIAAPPIEVGRREGIEIFARQSELVDASEPVE